MHACWGQLLTWAAAMVSGAVPEVLRFALAGGTLCMPGSQCTVRIEVGHSSAAAEGGAPQKRRSCGRGGLGAGCLGDCRAGTFGSGPCLDSSGAFHSARQTAEQALFRVNP